MKTKVHKFSDIPTAEQLSAELERVKYNRRYKRILRTDP